MWGRRGDALQQEGRAGQVKKQCSFPLISPSCLPPFHFPRPCPPRAKKKKMTKKLQNSRQSDRYTTGVRKRNTFRGPEHLWVHFSHLQRSPSSLPPPSTPPSQHLFCTLIPTPPPKRLYQLPPLHPLPYPDHYHHLPAPHPYPHAPYKTAPFFSRAFF